MQLLRDVDSSMRRAVQQENRSMSMSSDSLPSSSTTNNRSKIGRGRGRARGRRGSANSCCMLSIMLIPILSILVLMYVLKMYNVMVAYEEAHKQQLQQQQLHAPNELQSDEERQQLQLVRKRRADAARLAARMDQSGEVGEESQSSSSSTTVSTLILDTQLGSIRIKLQPNLSPGSVDYIQRLVESKVCRRCNFYRAEKPGILQGVMANKDVATNEELGSCPPGMENVHNDCPEWDQSCACHGPVMTRGSVAWAAGEAGGPDFFIDAYKKPADWWGTQHTNFGFIEDAESLKIVDQFFELPTHEFSGMHHLEQPVHFDMRLE